MSHENDFEKIMSCSFSQEDVRRIEENAGVNPYALEPVSPRREELLECFNGMLAALTDMQVEKDWDKLTTEFSNHIIPMLDIHPGDQILMKGGRSFLTDTGGLGTLDENAEVVGDFWAMVVDEWFNVPFIEEMDRLEDYRVESGLHVVLGGAAIQCSVTGERDFVGSISVPLNHGRPDIYKILR